MRIRGIIATKSWEHLRNGLSQDAKQIEHRSNRPQTPHKSPKNNTNKSSAKVI